jgi:hypothetical protein
MSSGGLTGLVGGVTVTLAMASQYDGGLYNFVVNTSQNYSVLAGCIASVGISTGVCCAVSMATNCIKTDADVKAEWAKTLAIDSPLNPWLNTYSEELTPVLAASGRTRVELSDLETIFASTKRISYIGSAVGLCLFLVLIPGVMSSFETLTLGQFTGWLLFCQVWTLVCAVFVLLVPPAEEIRKIYRKYRESKPPAGEDSIDASIPLNVRL